MKPTPKTSRYPVLSFKELEAWITLISPKILGSRVERLFVPETKAHPETYFKKEWVLELHSPHQSHQLYLSLRAQAPGICVYPSKFFKACGKASRSGFDLSLGKALEGSRLTGIRCHPGERLVILSFKSADHFELHLKLIPSSPVGVILENEKLLSSSDQSEAYALPATRELTPELLLKIPFRPELFPSVAHYQKLWEEARLENALQIRRSRLEQTLKTEFSSINSKVRSLTEQLQKSEQEPDWNYFGSLLQTHFHSKPKSENGFFELLDYEKDETVKIPADPKLGLKEQLTRYFHSAKRNKKRLEETAIRIEGLIAKKLKIEGLEQLTESALGLQALQEVELKLGISDTGRFTLKSKEQKKLAEFSGNQFVSKEGLTILVGRNLGENLELTFKIARGNDLWLHVKGRSGSHAVILLPPKRTASLDTLLDAATLCILHSGGKEWGKTEVDYTQRKYVKKIKNQTEVSYTNNKTLSVTIEEDRLKRLSAGNGSAN